MTDPIDKMRNAMMDMGGSNNSSLQGALLKAVLDILDDSTVTTLYNRVTHPDGSFNIQGVIGLGEFLKIKGKND